MFEVLTGTGLALSAGLNAYIPLVTLGLLSRFTSLVELPQQWAWLGNGWVLTILAALLFLEIIADKVPVVDHVNDMIQTLVRPTAGGIVFGAGSGSHTPAITDPGEFFSSGMLVPFILGLVLALGAHVGKAGLRSVVNLSTAGIGAPVASTVEDISALAMTVLALLLPLLLIVFVLVLTFIGFWVYRKRRARARLASPP